MRVVEISEYLTSPRSILVIGMAAIAGGTAAIITNPCQMLFGKKNPKARVTMESNP